MRIKNTPNFKGGRKERDAPSSGCETHVGLYTDEEVQFLNAVQAFQKRWKLRFLSHTHYLRIFKEMGYTHPTDQNSHQNPIARSKKPTISQRNSTKSEPIKRAKNTKRTTQAGKPKKS